MSSSTPPSRPWIKGPKSADKDYSCFSLEVRIVEDANGWVFSGHDFATPEDCQLASTWKNMGVKQISFALSTEALRREVFLCLLTKMTKAPELLEWFQEGDAAYRERIQTEIANAALATFMGMAQKMLPEVTREVFEMVLAQVGRTKPNPEE